MDVDYIVQPDTQLGKVLSELLDADPSASRIVFVSAFVSLQTIMRVKHQVIDLKENGVGLRFVLGIDLGGTSQEVLKEMFGWGIDVRIVKHRIPGHTFHPKLYLFQWADQAAIIIGSNNLTAEFLDQLIARGEVPTEAEARKGRDVAADQRWWQPRRRRPHSAYCPTRCGVRMCTGEAGDT